MTPRAFAAHVRRQIEAYRKATGVDPVVEFEGGERFTIRAPGDRATSEDEARTLQRELDGAFKA